MENWERADDGCIVALIIQKAKKKMAKKRVVIIANLTTLFA
jgi:hypothetical protein